MVPPARRAGAYGVFDTGFGVAWFLGSALMGVLYDRSVTALVIFSIVSQLAAIPILLFVARGVRAVAWRSARLLCVLSFRTFTATWPPSRRWSLGPITRLPR